MFRGRGPNKLQNPYVLRDMYNEYIKDIDEDSLYYIDWDKYKQIQVEMFKEIMRRILETSSEFQLPYKLGTLSVIKKMPKAWDSKHLTLDYKASDEFGKSLYLLNEHSDGYKMRFRWSKRRSLTKNKSFYKFIASRDNKRKMCFLIKEGKTDYFEV